MITGPNGAPRINVAAGQSYATELLPNDEFILELAVALMVEIQFASCYPSIRRDAITRSQRDTGDSRTPPITPHCRVLYDGWARQFASFFQQNQNSAFRTGGLNNLLSLLNLTILL